MMADPNDLQSPSGAILSPDQQYRYALWRRWHTLTTCRPPMVFVMLNPSTADAALDDHTIRCCIRFARRELCGGIVVVNLYAFRTTYPSVLATVADPVGPDNDEMITGVLLGAAHTQGSIVVAAWGATPMAQPRAGWLRAAAARHRVGLSCLGVTVANHPRHPSRLPNDQPLTDWPTS